MLEEQAVTADVMAIPETGERLEKSLGARIGRSIRLVTSSWIATVGLSLVVFWILIAIGSYVLPLNPYAQDVTAVNTGPSWAYPLGTDDIGRCLLARIVHGSRLILTLAPLSVVLSLLLGATLGLLGGYVGGIVDEIVMRVLDAIMAFPQILLYLLIIAAIGASATNVVVAITLGGIPGVARLVRSLALDIKTRDYVAAAKTRGESPWYIMFVEILPNARGPIIIDAMLRVGYAVFAIGTLGFLGLGVPPPSPDWGSMVARGQRYIFVNSWAVLWPALAISSLVVGLNLFADGLREETMRYQ